jgi:hypothetical protein
MATEEQVKAAIERLKAEWDEQGECQDCGWHDTLFSYRGSYDYEDIEEALDKYNGWLMLLCHCECGCRGHVEVYIGEKEYEEALKLRPDW